MKISKTCSANSQKYEVNGWLMGQSPSLQTCFWFWSLNVNLFFKGPFLQINKNLKVISVKKNPYFCYVIPFFFLSVEFSKFLRTNGVCKWNFPSFYSSNRCFTIAHFINLVEAYVVCFVIFISIMTSDLVSVEISEHGKSNCFAS